MRRRDGEGAGKRPTEAEETQGPLTFPSPLLTLSIPLHFPQLSTQHQAPSILSKHPVLPQNLLLPAFTGPSTPLPTKAPTPQERFWAQDARPTQVLSVVIQGMHFTQLANSARFMETYCVREGHNEPEYLCPPAAHRLTGRW